MTARVSLPSSLATRAIGEADDGDEVIAEIIDASMLGCKNELWDGTKFSCRDNLELDELNEAKRETNVQHNLHLEQSRLGSV